MSDEALWAEARLGKDAEEFLSSQVGRYMLGRAEQEEKEALEALATVAFWRWRRVIQLQAQVWRAKQFQQYLGEMVLSGRQALDTLDSTKE